MEAQGSLTAIGAASARAAHLLIDAEPKIFRDDFALRFSGFEGETSLRDHLEGMQAQLTIAIGAENARTLSCTVRSAILLRSRLSEDAFERARRRGVTRLVSLGAGLESFAWRYPELADEVEVFEIDHPASQEWKRQRLDALGVAQPRNLKFLPVDFENETLIEGLRKGGFPMDKPAFLSWLGVVTYLQRETALDTLKQVAMLAPGSEIAFTFMVPERLMSDVDREVFQMTSAGATARGEPLLSFFEPEELMAELRDMGFTHIEHLGPEVADRTYFAGRSDGLRAAGMEQTMLARVG